MRAPRAICVSLALLLLGLLGASCERGGAARVDKPVSGQAPDFASRPALDGGDARAWLTPRGTAGDSGYCAAQLKLPLARIPAWAYDYTAAEFSQSAPADIVHYNGTLVVGAECTMLLGLDALTGSRMFQRDAYAHLKKEHKDESLIKFFMHPQGLLTARDDLNRFYCWDLARLADPGAPQQHLAPLWLSADPGQQESGLVAYGGSFITYWSGMIHALAMADGRQQWQYPDLLPAFESDGIVESKDGVIVRWSLFGDVVAVSAADGALLWKLSLASRPFCAVIDDARARLYIPTDKETLECRDLHSGALKWSYSWRDLVSDSERQRLATEHGLERVVVWPADLMAGPGGVWIALANGDVLSIAADGKLSWRVSLPTPLIGGLAFANGLLIGEVYLGDDMQRHPKFGPLLGPFNPAPPDWSIIRNASAYELRHGLFLRFGVLDATDGHLADSFEVRCFVQTLILPSPTPAGEMIVFGYPASPTRDRNEIRAYNWLEGGTG